MTKIARGTTRPPKIDAPPTHQDMKLTIKQLISPPEHAPIIKDLTVTNIDKPDVHLRSDLVKPMEMMRIHSAQRVMKTQSNTENSALHLDDESVHSENYNFEEMVRVGRPERDLSLHKPLMRKLQSLRRYKMGTSPNLKAGLLRETLEPIAKDNNTKRLLTNLSARGRPGSPLASIVFSESKSLEDVFGQTRGMMATSASSPTFRATSALNTDRAKDIIVREGGDVNMCLYHLSSQGKRTVRTVQSSRARGNSPTDLVTDSIDSSNLSSPVEGEEEEPQYPAMYDPSTVRLPRMEIVPGYGSTTPAIESRLGAYRVHSSKAVTAAAALEEASVFESASRALSMSSQQGGKGDDSYRTDRLEDFYRSAATSQRQSLLERKMQAGGVEKNEAGEEEKRQERGDESPCSRSVSTYASSIQISAQGVHLATNPPVPSCWQQKQQGPRQRLHCGKCFKAAQMWCQQCTAAFCGVCWGQVPHHDLTQMSSSPPRPLTSSLSHSSPVKHTYAKSVLFQSYESNTKPSIENNKYSQTSAAKIPLPEYVVTQYDEYPAPPVYIDGKGHVVEDLIRKRPVTAPVTTQEELHRLQMSNHFKKQSQQEQYNQLLALKYRAATTGAPNGTSSGFGFPEKAYPSLGVSNGITYKQKEPRPMAHSKGDVVVRKNKSKNARLRPTSPSLTANPNGTLSPGYSAKPRTGSKPLVGILRDGTPGDWKTQLFAGNDVQDSRRGNRRSGRAVGGGKATTPFAQVKPL